MPEPAPDAAPFRRRLRDRLLALERGLVPVAEDVLAAGSRVDQVARDARGAAVLVMVAEADDAGLLTRALAHAAWLEPRLADWAQLAPDLGLDPSAPVRAWLVCRHFAPETEAALAALPPGRVELVAVQGPDEAPGPWLERRAAPAGTAGPGPGEEAPLEVPDPAPFRSGLREADLEISAGERRDLLAPR